MKHLVLVTLAIVATLNGCVAPTLTIYGRGAVRTADGSTKLVPVKEFQMYSDSVGRTTIAGSNVTFTSEGGVYNSPIIRESGTFAAKVGRSWVQPIVNWLGIGGVVGPATNPIPTP